MRFAILLTLALLPIAPADEPKKAEWVPLFNGKNLDG